MTQSQYFVPIKEVDDNLVFLEDGSVSMIITTSAVNFALLFETEQISIIESFAGFLNSLSFPIQIVVNSKRLDVSSYLHTLDKALAAQTNPMLKTMTMHYRRFVESIIKENDVLDKQFYIALTVNSIELGVLKKSTLDKTKKAMAILMPRRDHVVRQLFRLGLKAHQLDNMELLRLFYESYNPEVLEQAFDTPSLPVQNQAPVAPIPTPPVKPVVALRRLPNTPTYRPQTAPSPPQIQTQVTQAPINTASTPVNRSPAMAGTVNLAPPFVVEELTDDFGP